MNMADYRSKGCLKETMDKVCEYSNGLEEDDFWDADMEEVNVLHQCTVNWDREKGIMMTL